MMIELQQVQDAWPLNAAAAAQSRPARSMESRHVYFLLQYPLALFMGYVFAMASEFISCLGLSFPITCAMIFSRRLTAAPWALYHGITRHFSAISMPRITNEPFLHYAPGSPERREVLAACKSARDECPDVPLVINGHAVRTGDIGHQVELPNAIFAQSTDLLSMLL
jgi:hypothetical protein